MIKVTMLRAGDDLIGFTYKGHAGYADYGYDVVCAAVTAQLMMAYNGLELVAKLPLEMEMEPQGGYFSFRLQKVDEKEVAEARVIMETLKLGLMAVQQQYEENITLEEEEV